MTDRAFSRMSDVHPQRLCGTPIAIVGLSCLFPQSSNVSAFWQNIMDSKDCISDVPDTHWSIDDYYDPDPGAEDKTYCKRGGFIPPTPFNPIEFGIPPSSLDVTDILQLLSLVTAKAALRDAGYEEREFRRDRTGVILGVTGANSLTSPLSTRLQYPVWEKVLKSRGLSSVQIDDIIQAIKKAYAPWEENSFPGMLGNVVAGRIANRLDLGATNCTVDAACASSLSAMRMAIDELVERRADMMITGGCDAENTILMFMCFSKTPAFSPTGVIRPFDVNADGTLIGEGMGMLVLKRLEDAEQDGDRIYAVIKGLGSSSDGRFKSIYAPRGDGQIRCLERAYMDAGQAPWSVGLIEAHGTGTAVGDATEVGALLSVMQASGNASPHIALGSVKSQIGHTKAAAGAAGAIKAALSLHHQVLPASINVDKPNPGLGLEQSSVYLNTRTRPWFKNYGQEVRRAGISSFGFGGTNFHLVLEEYAGDRDPCYRLDHAYQPCVVSADTPDELLNRLSALYDGTDSGVPPVMDQDIPPFHARIGWVSASPQHWREQLQAAISMLKAHKDEESVSMSGIHYRRNAMSGTRVAALFPGQGSQHLEMGGSAVCAYPTLHRSLSAMDAAFGESSPEVPTCRIFPPPVHDRELIEGQEKQLQETRYAQPSIGALSMGHYRLLQDAGLTVEMAAGHSFGELTALWAGGCLDDADYLATAIARGNAMSPPGDPDFDPGTMIAISASSEQVQTLIDALQDVWLCNLNTPVQQVVGGTRNGVDALKDALRNQNISFTELPVSGAFHTPLVRHAAESFAAHLKGVSFRQSRIPVYRNSDGSTYPEGGEEIRHALSSHLLEPVNFNHMIEAMYGDGARVFVEFGPKPVLSRMVGKILAGRPHLAVALDQGVPGHSARCLMDAVVQLRVAGVALTNPDTWHRPAPVPPKASGTVVWLNGVNHVSESRRKAFQEALSSPVSAAAPEPRVAGAALTESFGPIIDIQGGHSVPIDSVNSAPENAPRNDGMDTHALGILDKLRQDNAELHAAYLSMHRSQVSESFDALRRAQDMLTAHPERGDSVRSSLADIARLVAETQAQTSALHQQYLDQSRFFGEFLRGPGAPRSSENEKAATRLPNVVAGLPPLASEHLRQPPPPAAASPAVGGVASPVVTTVSSENETAHRALAPAIAHASAVPPPGQTALPISEEATHVLRKDIETQLLNVVSEKTGYAVDMLDMDMDIESDLGIDSIKRVEILSAMQGTNPALQAPGPEQMGNLRTLSQILDHFLPSSHAISTATGSSASGTAGAAGAPGVAIDKAMSSSETVAVTGDADEANVRGMLLDIVAEKTGYPVEVLDMSMDLESDLGIDSIKRVEILASVQSANPSFVPPPPESMAELRTLQQIVDAMTGHQKKKLSDSSSPAPESPQAVTRRYDLTLCALSRPARLVGAYPPASHCLIVARPDERTRALAATLIEEGWKVTILADLHHPDQNMHPDARMAFLERIQADCVETALSEIGSVDVLIHVFPFAEDDSLAPDSAAVQQLRLAFLLAKFTKLPLSRLGRNARAAFVSVASMDGQWGMCGSMDGTLAAGALPGLIKTLSVESPEIFCRAIDLDPDYSPETWTSRVVDELLAADHDIVEVAWKGETRYGLRLSSELPDRVVEPINDVVHVVTGGAKGITALCVQAMAERHSGGRFLLLGRTDISSPEPEWALNLEGNELRKAAIDALRRSHQKVTPRLMDRTINEIESVREIRDAIRCLAPHCLAVEYLSIDITNLSGLDTLMAHPMLQGDVSISLIHGAGGLADRLLENKSLDDFDHVFSAKIHGLDNLLKVIPSERIARLWLFSSVAGLFGNIGQADYAMANELLNRIAARHLCRHRDCHVMSINWGAWDAGMVTPQVKAIFEARNIPLISVGEGTALFASCASAAPPAHGVFLAGAPSPLSPATDLFRAIRKDVDVEIDLSVLKESSLLAAHQIGDDVVLPLSFALGCAIHQIESSLRGGDVERVSAFRVLRGLLIDDSMPPSLHLCLRQPTPSHEGEDVSIDATLRTDETQPRYQGRAFGLRSPGAGNASPGTRPPSMADAEDARTLYTSGVLFHRPGFQFLKRYRMLPNGDLACIVAFDPPPEPGLIAAHSGRSYCPLLLDAMLQAALCLVRMSDGEPGLPMELSALRIVRRPDYDGSPVFVQAHLLSGSAHQSRISLLATGAGGQMLASTEACVIKSQTLESRFQQNNLSNAE